MKRFIYFFSLCIISLNATAQWQDYPELLSAPSNITWLDSDYAYINQLQSDWIVEEVNSSLTYIRVIHLLNGEAFPIEDTVIVGSLGSDNELCFFGWSGVILDTIDYKMTLDEPNIGVFRVLFYAFDPDHWFLMVQQNQGKETTLITQDQGKSWTKIPNLFQISATNQNINYQVIDSWVWLHSSAKSDTLFRSKDFGLNWEIITLAESLKPVPNLAFAFANKQVGLMTCYSDGGLARTEDGGLTWNTDGLTRPIKQNSRICFAKAGPTKEALFFIYGPKGCHYSASNGQWWHQLDILDHELLSFYDSEHGFSFYRYNGSLDYKRRSFRNSLFTDIEELSSTEPNFYPIPTSGQIFSNLEEATPVVIYNLMGMKVLESEACTMLQPLNVSLLENGYYFIHIPAMAVTRTIHVLK